MSIEYLLALACALLALLLPLAGGVSPAAALLHALLAYWHTMEWLISLL